MSWRYEQTSPPESAHESATIKPKPGCQYCKGSGKIQLIFKTVDCECITDQMMQAYSKEIPAEEPNYAGDFVGPGSARISMPGYESATFQPNTQWCRGTIECYRYPIYGPMMDIPFTRQNGTIGDFFGSVISVDPGIYRVDLSLRWSGTSEGFSIGIVDSANVAYPNFPPCASLNSEGMFMNAGTLEVAPNEIFKVRVLDLMGSGHLELHENSSIMIQRLQ